MNDQVEPTYYSFYGVLHETEIGLYRVVVARPGNKPGDPAVPNLLGNQLMAANIADALMQAYALGAGTQWLPGRHPIPMWIKGANGKIDPRPRPIYSHMEPEEGKE